MRRPPLAPLATSISPSPPLPLMTPFPLPLPCAQARRARQRGRHPGLPGRQDGPAHGPQHLCPGLARRRVRRPRPGPQVGQARRAHQGLNRGRHRHRRQALDGSCRPADPSPPSRRKPRACRCIESALFEARARIPPVSQTSRQPPSPRARAKERERGQKSARAAVRDATLRSGGRRVVALSPGVVRPDAAAASTKRGQEWRGTSRQAGRSAI